MYIHIIYNIYITRFTTSQCHSHDLKCWSPQSFCRHSERQVASSILKNLAREDYMAEIYASTRSIGREQRGAAGIEVSRIEAEADSHTPSLIVFFFFQDISCYWSAKWKMKCRARKRGFPSIYNLHRKTFHDSRGFNFFGITALSNLSLPGLKLRSVVGQQTLKFPAQFALLIVHLARSSGTLVMVKAKE